MKVNQETIPFSTGHYWVNGAGTGVWRTAKKNHICKGGKRPYREHYIKAGERFLDTGERTPDGVWATYKCCQTCADSRATSIYGEPQSCPIETQAQREKP